MGQLTSANGFIHHLKDNVPAVPLLVLWPLLILLLLLHPPRNQRICIKAAAAAPLTAGAAAQPCRMHLQ